MKSSFLEHTLPNGLRVVCEVMPRVSSAAAGFYVGAGSRHESPELHGVSHFLEHMCFKGNERRDCHAINVAFDELGSIYNAFTSKEHTVYYGWVPAQRLGDQLELLTELVRPSLPEADFQTERNVILEEIAMNDDAFERHVGNFLHHAVFENHALAHEILGEKETIANMRREQLVEYHRRRYAADNMTLVAAGNLDPQEFFAAAGRYCGRWERGGANGKPTPPAIVTRGVRKLVLEQFQQQAIAIVYPSVPEGHAHEDAIEAFTQLFGGPNSRCYWNIVQKGICSQAGAFWLSYRDCGVMALYADGEPERCDEMLAALQEQAREVMERGFRPDELQRVRNQRRMQLALEAESPRTRLMQVVDDLEVHGYPRTTENRMAAVEAVTEQSIAGYLREYPITGEGLVVSIGPRDWPPTS